MDGHCCPFCSNKKVSVTNSLAQVFPELAKEWHVSSLVHSLGVYDLREGSHRVLTQTACDDSPS